MHYIDGFVAAVPDARRETYMRYAAEIATLLKQHGALRVVECWGDDVPEGQLTSFPMAVKREPGESEDGGRPAHPAGAQPDALRRQAPDLRWLPDGARCLKEI